MAWNWWKNGQRDFWRTIQTRPTGMWEIRSKKYGRFWPSYLEMTSFRCLKVTLVTQAKSNTRDEPLWMVFCFKRRAYQRANRKAYSAWVHRGPEKLGTMRNWIFIKISSCFWKKSLRSFVRDTVRILTLSRYRAVAYPHRTVAYPHRTVASSNRAIAYPHRKVAQKYPSSEG